MQVVARFGTPASFLALRGTCSLALQLGVAYCLLKKVAFVSTVCWRRTIRHCCLKDIVRARLCLCSAFRLLIGGRKSTLLHHQRGVATVGTGKPPVQLR